MISRQIAATGGARSVTPSFAQRDSRKYSPSSTTRVEIDPRLLRRHLPGEEHQLLDDFAGVQARPSRSCRGRRRPAGEGPAAFRASWANARMLPNGSFSSCATPAASCPIVASRSACRNWPCKRQLLLGGLPPLDDQGDLPGDRVDQVPLLLEERPFVKLRPRFDVADLDRAAGLAADQDLRRLPVDALPEAGRLVDACRPARSAPTVISGYCQAGGSISTIPRKHLSDVTSGCSTSCARL